MDRLNWFEGLLISLSPIRTSKDDGTAKKGFVRVYSSVHIYAGHVRMGSFLAKTLSVHQYSRLRAQPREYDPGTKILQVMMQPLIEYPPSSSIEHYFTRANSKTTLETNTYI